LRLFHIPPSKLAKRVIPVEETHHLCVADVIVSHREYARFYQSRVDMGHWLTMDTAAFEGQDTTIETLVEALHVVKPSEIVLPDRFQDSKETVARSTNAARELREHGYDGAFMVVPHGKTWHEYLYCLEELVLALPYATIGIIEEVEQLYNLPRPIVVEAITEFYGNDIHFLGVTEDLAELQDEATRARVRSCDTAKFVVWGLNGITVNPKSIMPGVPVPLYPGRKSLGGRNEYFDYANCSEEAVSITRTNIRRWREYLHG
jgi:hypothetical protein